MATFIQNFRWKIWFILLTFISFLKFIYQTRICSKFFKTKWINYTIFSATKWDWWSCKIIVKVMLILLKISVLHPGKELNRFSAWSICERSCDKFVFTNCTNTTAYDKLPSERGFLYYLCKPWRYFFGIKLIQFNLKSFLCWLFHGKFKCFFNFRKLGESRYW